MAKKPQVLGNDPFQRGAADRSSGKEAATVDQAKAEPRVKAEVESKAKPEPKPKSQPKAKAKKAATAASGTTKPGSAKEGAEKEPQAGAAKPKAKAKPKPRRSATRSSGQAETTAETHSKPKRKTKLEKDAQAQPETSAKAHPEAKAKPQAENGPMAQAKQPSESQTTSKLPPPSKSETPTKRQEPQTAGGSPRTLAPPPTGIDAIYASVIALRRMLHLPSAVSGAQVDEFGKDAEFTERVRPLLEWVYDKWFRVETSGFEKLPRDVPLILVANRAGAIPWDSVMLTLAARRAGLEVRPLVEDSIFHFPSMGLLVNRLGAIRASPENGERILGRGEAVAVFPEGATGFGKPYRERYKLQRFGRGGFVKLALRTGALVVPVSIVGSEEIHPLLARLDVRPFGFPFLPITPTFPWLGAAGLLPFPSKWRIEAEEPFDFRRHGADAAQDDPLVMRLAEEVRATIQTMLDDRLAQRTSAFL